MLAAITQIEPIEDSENQPLRLLREKNDDYDTFYQANIKEVQEWLLGIEFSFTETICRVLSIWEVGQLPASAKSVHVVQRCQSLSKLPNFPEPKSRMD